MTNDPATDQIHHPYRPPGGFEGIQPGVHKASTILYSSVADVRRRRWQDRRSYTYGTHGTPTSYTLEARIATLEGGLYCTLAPSGLSAIALVHLAMLKPGDEVLLPDNAYDPVEELANGLLADMGITHRLYDAMRPDMLDELIVEGGSNIKLVLLEAAGSVTLEFPDLRELVRVCRKHDVTCVLDNTWGAGLAFNPFELGDGLGVDISIHALTKYPSGGGDLLMGSVTTRDEALHRRVQDANMHLGMCVGMNDVEAVLHGLPTLKLRYEQHDRSTRRLARWLAKRPEVAQVLHPALPTSPGHEHWKALCKGAAGLLTIVFEPQYETERIHAFVDALRIFRIGYSWGGPMSLAMPYSLDAMRSLPTVGQGLEVVRLVVGLEDPKVLQADLKQALRQLRG